MEKFIRFFANDLACQVLMAGAILILTALTMRPVADLYLSGAAGWIVIFTLGLYLVPFILPFTGILVPFFKAALQEVYAGLALLFDAVALFIILQHPHIMVYTDEAGGGYPMAAGTRLAAIVAAGILIFIFLAYLLPWGKFQKIMNKKKETK